MPSEEPVSLSFFMQIHFASHCQEVFAADQVDPLHSKSVMTQLQLLLPKPGTKLPFTSGILLCVKLQTRVPPCPQFRVRHAHPKSGRAVTQPSTGSSWWPFLWYFCGQCLSLVPPPQQCIGVALLTVCHWLSQMWLFTLERYLWILPNEAGAILYMINTMCPSATKGPSDRII